MATLTLQQALDNARSTLNSVNGLLSTSNDPGAQGTTARQTVENFLLASRALEAASGQNQNHDLTSAVASAIAALPADSAMPSTGGSLTQAQKDALTAFFVAVEKLGGIYSGGQHSGS